MRTTDSLPKPHLSDLSEKAFAIIGSFIQDNTGKGSCDGTIVDFLKALGKFNYIKTVAGMISIRHAKIALTAEIFSQNNAPSQFPPCGGRRYLFEQASLYDALNAYRSSKNTAMVILHHYFIQKYLSPEMIKKLSCLKNHINQAPNEKTRTALIRNISDYDELTYAICSLLSQEEIYQHFIYYRDRLIPKINSTDVNYGDYVYQQVQNSLYEIFSALTQAQKIEQLPICKLKIQEYFCYTDFCYTEHPVFVKLQALTLPHKKIESQHKEFSDQLSLEHASLLCSVSNQLRALKSPSKKSPAITTDYCIDAITGKRSIRPLLNELLAEDLKITLAILDKLIAEYSDSENRDLFENKSMLELIYDLCLASKDIKLHLSDFFKTQLPEVPLDLIAKPCGPKTTLALNLKLLSITQTDIDPYIDQMIGLLSVHLGYFFHYVGEVFFVDCATRIISAQENKEKQAQSFYHFWNKLIEKTNAKNIPLLNKILNKIPSHIGLIKPNMHISRANSLDLDNQQALSFYINLKIHFPYLAGETFFIKPLNNSLLKRFDLYYHDLMPQLDLTHSFSTRSFLENANRKSLKIAQIESHLNEMFRTRFTPTLWNDQSLCTKEFYADFMENFNQLIYATCTVRKTLFGSFFAKESPFSIETHSAKALIEQLSLSRASMGIIKKVFPDCFTGEITTFSNELRCYMKKLVAPTDLNVVSMLTRA